MFLSVESNCFMREMIIDNFQKVWNNSSGLFYLKNSCGLPLLSMGCHLPVVAPLQKVLKRVFIS
jgi:hypothetical protein